MMYKEIGSLARIASPSRSVSSLSLSLSLSLSRALSLFLSFCLTRVAHNRPRQGAESNIPKNLRNLNVNV